MQKNVLYLKKFFHFLLGVKDLNLRKTVTYFNKIHN